MSYTVLLPALAAAAVATAAAPALASWARRRQLLDVPNERSSHSIPTPRVGGVGIVIAVAAGLWIAKALGYGGIPNGLVLAGGALAVAAISLVDDVRALPASIRLAGHVGVAAFAASSALPGTGQGAWEQPAAVLLLVVWIAGMVNAYNFMDGIDGIAAGQAVVAGCGWMLAGLLLGHAPLAAIGGVVAGSAAGFLRVNWQPARVFMGDTGSAFLGYTFAALPLTIPASLTSALPAGALFVWPFVFDTSFTFVRRLRRGERVMQAHRSHLYQRLVSTGLSHAQVTTAYLALAALGIPAGLLLLRGSASMALAWAGLIPVAAMALWLTVVRRERAAPPAAPSPRCI